jgi:hypothetical protein
MVAKPSRNPGQLAKPERRATPGLLQILAVDHRLSQHACANVAERLGREAVRARVYEPEPRDRLIGLQS